jgi:ABC-2 type transport system ATP-binding protein
VSAGAPAVEARGLTVRFGAFTAVDRLSFSVARGEIFGFLGANGAGKTTTIRVLCGLLPPTEGEVRVAGAGYADGERALKDKVGYMSQRFTLYNDLTVRENLEFIASLRKLPREALERRRDELLELIGFHKELGEKVGALSGGTKQMVSLAAAMLHDPEIVFLDEPTAGVTPAGRERFWELIRRVVAQGKTVFVTTHYMDEAEQCGRIALMREGKLVALDTPQGLKKSCFPEPVYEFEPRGELPYARLEEYGRHPAFSFFEPYGLRFHAAVKDSAAWSRHRPDLERVFTVKEISPSLEDVFIRLVERPR